MAERSEVVRIIRRCGTEGLLEALENAERQGFLPNSVSKAWNAFDHRPLTPAEAERLKESPAE